MSMNGHKFGYFLLWGIIATVSFPAISVGMCSGTPGLDGVTANDIVRGADLEIKAQNCKFGNKDLCILDLDSFCQSIDDCLDDVKNLARLAAHWHFELKAYVSNAKVYYPLKVSVNRIDKFIVHVDFCADELKRLFNRVSFCNKAPVITTESDDKLNEIWQSLKYLPFEQVFPKSADTIEAELNGNHVHLIRALPFDCTNTPMDKNALASTICDSNNGLSIQIPNYMNDSMINTKINAVPKGNNVNRIFGSNLMSNQNNIKPGLSSLQNQVRNNNQNKPSQTKDLFFSKFQKNKK